MADKAPKILVTDDDQSIREMLYKKLTKMGMDVSQAADGVEALELLDREHIDLLVLDLNMPRLNGFEVTQRVRANPLLMHTPILLLTARDSLDDKVTGLNTGADDYVVKPFDWPELIARIEMHLRRAKRDQEVNPLTLLPGGLSIERAMALRLSRHTQFAACYIDLDNFKSFNDRYGFVAGNDIIRLMAEIIVNVVREVGSPSWLVGHIGGDDFIILAGPDLAEAAAGEIIRRFDLAVPAMYSEEDRERGYIYTKNRRGELDMFAFVSVSIAVVLYDGTTGVDIDQIARASADLKHHLKSHAGSIYMMTKPAWQVEAR